MTAVFQLQPGPAPLLISVPHDGRELPADIRDRMTDAGRAIPDTDWHVAKLYEFAAHLGASFIVANYSRYVVDLNRSADDGDLYPGQVATGLCPERTFAGDAIYRFGGVDEVERDARVQDYWRPYHDKIRATLDSMRAAHGFALLWDAHSIPGEVPRLFTGELPTLNLGSNDSQSCAGKLETAVAAVAIGSDYTTVVNGRFKGGYITRSFGAPANDTHALQLEISQRAYMDEKSLQFDSEKAEKLRDTLRLMLQTFLDKAKND